MRKSYSRAAVGAMFLACLAGCGSESYRPAPLLPDVALASYVGRSLTDPALAEFASRQGRTGDVWPPARWGWAELSIAARFYHPDLATARALQQVAAAAAAAQRPPVGVGAVLEHHKDTVGKSSAWSYGVDVELPVAAAGRRAARSEQAEAQLSAARFDAAATQWQVRVRILRRCIDLFAAHGELTLLRDEAEARKELWTMLTRRLELGAISAAEVVRVEGQVLAVEQAVGDGAMREADAFAALAAAVGVTAEKLREVQLSLDALVDLVDIQGSAESGLLPKAGVMRDMALRERADLLQLLAEYAAAEAAVKLEVARQYPEFSLKPGYLWDQGDSRWSLALGWLVPPTLGNQPAIREAEAKRQLAAAQFMARQAAIVAEIDAAIERYHLAEEAVARSQAAVQAALDSEARSRRGLAAGAADRNDLVANRLERAAAQRQALSRRASLLQSYADLVAALQPPGLSAGALALDGGRASLDGFRQ